MEDFVIWFIIFGVLFLFMGISNTWLKHSPVSSSIIYLFLGVLLGPYFLNLLQIDLLKHSQFMEHLTEIAVTVSLFGAGLKLRPGFSTQKYIYPICLATISMIVSVALTAVAGQQLLGLSLGAAVLMGGILAPTDPVLASEVQLEDPKDKNNLKFTLTTEAGFNDGTAFPFVMLGLGLLGLHELGEYNQKWIFFDLIWPIIGGLGIGFLIGYLISKIHFKMRMSVKNTEVLFDFIALSCVCLAYGVALLCKTYGFLAVFAVGVTIRQFEKKVSFWKITHPHPELAKEVLTFADQLERILEVLVVILIGSFLRIETFASGTFLMATVLMCAIRPLSVYVLRPFFKNSKEMFPFVSWFGIRGIGSVYYLMYSIEHGFTGNIAFRMTHLTFGIITISILVHGISVTPLMKRYSFKF
jgi:NhaP-type Na+/H+ or K+/H+ antiporter